MNANLSRVAKERAKEGTRNYPNFSLIQGGDSRTPSAETAYQIHAIESQAYQGEMAFSLAASKLMKRRTNRFAPFHGGNSRGGLRSSQLS
jgi:hypothetical protein